MESQLKSQSGDEERRSQAAKIMNQVNVSEIAIFKKLTNSENSIIEFKNNLKYN